MYHQKLNNKLDYGAKVQYVKKDLAPPLFGIQIKHINPLDSL